MGEKDIFDTDRDYRNSVCMSLLQIGELTGHLTENFREDTKDSIYWPAIKGMRNLFAHNYGAVDVGLVWETAVSDIRFCMSSVIGQYVCYVSWSRRKSGTVIWSVHRIREFRRKVDFAANIKKSWPDSQLFYYIS